MPIKLKSIGGGSVSVDVPSTGTDYTLYAPANNATIFTDVGGTVNGAIKLAIVPFIEMAQTINYDYTITANTNAFTPGPISVANGINVTVPNGSFWIVT